MPETFAKQEAQVKLVDLLLLEDPETGRDLEPHEVALRKKLLQKYYEMGPVYPQFELKISHENLQRLIVKIGGIK